MYFDVSATANPPERPQLPWSSPRPDAPAAACARDRVTSWRSSPVGGMETMSMPFWRPADYPRMSRISPCAGWSELAWSRSPSALPWRCRRGRRSPGAGHAGGHFIGSGNRMLRDGLGACAIRGRILRGNSALPAADVVAHRPQIGRGTSFMCRAWSDRRIPITMMKPSPPVIRFRFTCHKASMAVRCAALSLANDCAGCGPLPVDPGPAAWRQNLQQSTHAPVCHGALHTRSSVD